MPKLISKGRVEFSCDECGELCKDFPSHYLKKKNHFCSRSCYSRFMVTKSDHYSKKGKKKVIKGSHKHEDWEEILRKFENKCAMCKSEGNLVKDHIKPLSEGGTNYIENIQPLCRICNNKKFCLGEV